MRLELRQIQGPAQGGVAQPWSFERGRRTLGRSADCDWQVLDTTRTVSKLHCAILRDREGFLLQDESANGTRVDGRLVLEGQTTRLAHDSRLEMGAFVFAVALSGEKDRDIDDPETGRSRSDDNLTISAILADVSPGGASASGILAGRVAEDWLSKTGANASDDLAAGRKGAAASMSRNVEIGWNGPPDPSDSRPALPDDWNADFDYGNRLEHNAATMTSVPIQRRMRRESEVEAVARIFDEPTTAASTVPEAESERKPDVVSRESRLLSRLEGLLRQCEEASAAAFAAFEVTDPVADEMPAPFDASREDTLLLRLGAVAQRQRLLATAIEAVLRDASHTLEPRIIEAQVDAESRSLRWLHNRTYWQAYRRHFSEGGKDLSIPDYFRKVVLQALGSSEPDKTVRSA